MILSSDEFISEMLKLAGTKEWMGTPMNLTIDKPRAETALVIERLLAGKSLEEGEEYEYIHPN